MCIGLIRYSVSVLASSEMHVPLLYWFTEKVVLVHPHLQLSLAVENSCKIFVHIEIHISVHSRIYIVYMYQVFFASVLYDIHAVSWGMFFRLRTQTSAVWWCCSGSYRRPTRVQDSAASVHPCCARGSERVWFVAWSRQQVQAICTVPFPTMPCSVIVRTVGREDGEGGGAGWLDT